VNKTAKSDWLTRYLYGKKFWVGGTLVTCQANSLTTAKQTIRYFRGNEKEFLVVYILEFIEPFDLQIQYESTIKSYLKDLQVNPHFTLAIWPNQTHSFAVLEAGNYRQNLDTKSVLTTFAKFDPSLVGHSSYLKPLNRSFTDFFHLWARQNMKGFQNDVDAFIKHDEKIHMLELKRPKESVRTWRPYCADLSNYIQFSNLCSKLSYRLINIAYTEADPGKMKIFKDVTFNNQKLNYLTANLQIEPDDELLHLIRDLKFHNEVSER
jgi:hypothetical protein